MDGSSDKLLRCIQCGSDYIWTEGEQRFYAKKGLQGPRRCLKCREERKQHGTYGSQVVSVDSATGQVLCRICRHPASRAASLRTGEAICSGCACGDTSIPTEEPDRLEYPEWESHFIKRKK